MSKQLNVVKYGGIVREVLNDLKPRKGSKINWTVFATNRKISSNLGTVLQRVGLVEKIKSGGYRSTVCVYVSKSKGEAIAQIIKEHDLLRHPNDFNAAIKAKDVFVQMGIVRVTNKPSQTEQVTAPRAATKESNPLKKFTSQALLFELGRRIEK